MPPIRSINEPRIKPPSGEIQQPAILTSAIPEPPKPTTTVFTAERIVGMILFQERLFVATENGVYMKNDRDIFERLKFEIVEEQNE